MKTKGFWGAAKKDALGEYAITTTNHTIDASAYAKTIRIRMSELYDSISKTPIDNLKSKDENTYAAITLEAAPGGTIIRVAGATGDVVTRIATTPSEIGETIMIALVQLKLVN